MSDFSSKKKLPKIYQSRVVTENNKRCFYSKNEGNNNIKNDMVVSKYNNLNVIEIIDDLLKNNVMYSSEVTLVLKNRKIRTRIIKRYDNYILTIDNDKINCNDIIDILE